MAFIRVSRTLPFEEMHMPHYIMVCEGRSEYAYLQRLQSFLEAQATDWDVPLRFIPKIPLHPDGSEQGGGFYRNVSSCYKIHRNANKNHLIQVWVDYDIYFRKSSAQERSNRASYLAKPSRIPDFLFSFHNFEDFLALHFDDATAQRWHSAFDDTHHAIYPLHADEYMPRFESVLSGYKKGSLDPDFISKESLLRLKKNLDMSLVAPTQEPHFRSFAEFLIDQIDRAFPNLLRS